MAVLSVLQNVAPLERQTLGEQVYTHVRHLLISGQLQPGDRLSLRSVADAMGVSMMPVREAVSRLVADRALEVLPNRAVRVPVIKAQQFSELAVIRTEIEGFAAGQAALNRTEAELGTIARLEERFRTMATAHHPDLPAAVEANQAFHFAVYEAAHLPALVEIIGALWLKVGPVINLDLRGSPERLAKGAAVPSHAAVLDAIRNRDAEGARTAIAADINTTATFLLDRKRLPA